LFLFFNVSHFAAWRTKIVLPVEGDKYTVLSFEWTDLIKTTKLLKLNSQAPIFTRERQIYLNVTHSLSNSPSIQRSSEVM
jgi:hypothetical protein